MRRPVVLITGASGEIGQALVAGVAATGRPVVTLDLQRISLGGSVFMHNQDILLPRLQAQVAGRLPSLTDGVELVPAGLGERVGDYAALALLSEDRRDGSMLDLTFDTKTERTRK